MKFAREDLLLYAVTDRRWLKEGETLCSQVEKAIRGGVSFVQLREKELVKEEFLNEAKKLRTLCKRFGVPFVINDNVEIAAISDADGVHVGQNDMDICLVREKLGPGKIIGASVHTVEEAILADAKPLPPGMIESICSAVRIPVIAIGGIDENNAGRLRGKGLCGVAVISAVFARPDVEAAAVRLRKVVDAALRNK